MAKKDMRFLKKVGEDMSDKLKGRLASKNTRNTIIREIKKDKVALVSCVFMISLVVVVFVCSLIFDAEEVFQINYDFTLEGWEGWNQPPSRRSLLGTDERGRDVLMLLIFGARNALMIVTLTTLISSVIGIVYGLISGYIGGFVDNVMMRIVELIAIFPNLIIIIIVIEFRGYTAFNFIIVTSLLTWTAIAKVVRTKLVQEKELDYIQASRTIGTSHFKIILHQLLPNLSSVIIASIALNAVSITGIEAGISFVLASFLGDTSLFVTPSLGILVSSAMQMITLRFRQWIWLPPLVLIGLIMFSINNIGEMLSRAADSRQH